MKRTGRSRTKPRIVQPPGHSAPFPALESWLTRHRMAVWLAIVLASIALRGLYFAQLSAGPGIAFHRLDETDMNYYDRWGWQIAHGDWLSTSIGVPMHPWHRDVAALYLAEHPDARAALQREAAASAEKADIDALLWSRWLGRHQFYQDPLYAYLIGVTYRLAGADVRGVFVWQMAMGVLTNVLIWSLSRRFFGETVAACAAVLTLLCGLLMYYELILLRESAIVFAGLALTWQIDRAFSRQRWTGFAVLGVSLGVACMLKSTFVLAGLAVGIAMVVRYRRDRQALLTAAGATAAGVLIAVMPLAARNAAAGVPPLSLASSGPLTFGFSNDVNYRVESGFAIDDRQMAQAMSETGSRWMPTVVRTLRAHTVTSFLSLVWRKWDRIWHWYEIPNNENFYYMRRLAPVLAWLPVTFWILSPLALAGLVLGVSRFKHAWPLYVLVACCLAPLLTFYVLGRFRIALAAAIVPFASLTLVQLLAWLSTRRYSRFLACSAVLVLLTLWTGRAMAPDRPLIRPSDWFMPYLSEYRTQIKTAVDSQNREHAVAVFLEFFRYEPSPAALEPSASGDVAEFFGRMHADCAALLNELGRTAEARAQLDQADRFFRLAPRAGR
jgi:4-amino-4-deoxy-L-arabinose transferase-like glycosyltransferase